MTNENIGCCNGHHVLKVIIGIIMAVVLVILAVYLVGLTRNSLRSYDYIGKSPDYKNIVTVEGTGKVTAKPDVASVNIGIISEGVTVDQVQKQNTDKMNAIVSAIKNQFKIDEKDIQTNNYTINPKYDWSDKVSKIVGYNISQSVNVKIRDFNKVGEILAKASELGANSVNGPTFVIDDPEVYKVQAREKAIAQAKEKSKVLADQVGINLGRIVNFNEFTAGGSPVPMYDSAMGMGGGLSTKASAPDIQAGSDEVVINVSISYEIK
ncbi:MAG: SIMPL domain-containing protein [Candidatus Buchananbacteria bacterium]